MRRGEVRHGAVRYGVYGHPLPVRCCTRGASQARGAVGGLSAAVEVIW